MPILGAVHSDDSGMAANIYPAPAIVVSGLPHTTTCTNDVSILGNVLHKFHLYFQTAVPKASPQMSVGKADVDTIVQLLRTTQEKLIHGLTHSRLDINYTGEQGMTLLHYAAMVCLYSTSQ